MPAYIKEVIAEHVQYAVDNDASIIYWVNSIGRVSFLKKEDNAVWKTELKSFKKRFKTGALNSLICNNMKITNEFGTWYQLIIQPEDEDVMPESPLPLLAFGVMVSGLCYYFKSEKDRDNVFKYLTQNN